jgi:hypothetical protein
MSVVKIVGIVLIAAGILGLVYGGFSYTKETHETQIGPLELSVKDKETVNVPVWAGVGAIVINGILLLVPSKNQSRPQCCRARLAHCPRLLCESHHAANAAR